MSSRDILIKTNSYIIRMNREDHLCWYHGKISREHAEEILREEGQGDGVFLVRESNTSNGDFVLSVLHQDQVWHYQIRRHGEDAFFSIDDNTKIHGLDSLIEHYQQSSSGLVTQLSAIVKRDPPPNDSRSHGRTNLLHRATKENNQTIVSELLKCGYRNFDAKNQDGQTAVHLACLHSSEEILKLLLKVGANVNSRDTVGNTPLHYACRSKPASYIRTLINAKANIQIRNIETGFVPLHEAAKHGNMEAVQELLKAKAPHMPRTISGEFPMDFAREAGHHQIAEFLQQYRPPAATTYSFQWYHGTLDRTEAIKLIADFEKNLRERLAEDAKNANQNEALADNDCTKETSQQTNNINGNNAEEKNDSKINKNNQHIDGIFLVRYSNRSGYVLTLLFDGQPRNFIIQKAMNHLYIDEGPYMPTLEHLVQHYMTFSDGLPVNLRHPVPPKPKPPLPLFSTMPKAMSKKQSSPSSNSSTSSQQSTSQHQRFAKRNLSHPGDDAMNRVGLFETDDPHHHNHHNHHHHHHHHQRQNEHQQNDMDKKTRDMHIFRSLKPRSRKNIIIDGMKSLRKGKLRTSPFKSDTNNKKKESGGEEESIKSQQQIDESLNLSQSIIKNLSFSTDFLNTASVNGIPSIEGGFYNIPKNNCAVVDIDIGENSPSIPAPPPPISINTSENSSNAKDNVLPLPEKAMVLNQDSTKVSNEKEDDYFTKSDKDICLEVYNAEKYFIDIPKTKSDSVNELTDIPPPLPSQAPPTTFAGYVPTVDIRVFLDNNETTQETSKILAESSAELREFSKHPERLDSMISTISTDSEFQKMFMRQTSSTSGTSSSGGGGGGQSSSENSKIKLNYFIPNECLTLDEIIGEGEFGSVYKGSLKYFDSLSFENTPNTSNDVRNCQVAIKTLRDEHCRTNKQEFLREASVMIQLQHHCIVKLIGISRGKTLMMVQELVPLGSMLNYILSYPDKVNPNYELKIWASQIACGMSYLESRHFVHRDLAARNILLSSRHQVKISDFGLSRALGSGNDCYQASQGGKWPIKWYAPESFNHGIFSHASDVWSYGITLWEMFSLGQPPYGEMRGVDAIKLIENGHRLPKPELCPENVYKIMENCWNYKPKDRPTFHYLAEYFAKDPEYQNLCELIKTEHIS